MDVRRATLADTSAMAEAHADSIRGRGSAAGRDGSRKRKPRAE
jgi:hypothetical protein